MATAKAKGLIIGAWLAALGLVIFLHRVDPENWSSLARRLLHSLHAPGFAVLAIAVWWTVLRRTLPIERRVAAVWLLCTAVSVLSELSQVPGPRNAEFSDLVVDNIGILAGLTLALLFVKATQYPVFGLQRRHLAIAAVPLLVATIAPTALAAASLLKRSNQLPVLMSFDSLLDRELYAGMDTALPERIAAPPGWPAGDGKVALAQSDGRWGTLLAMSPHPDWTAYAGLSFVAASAGNQDANIGLTLRAGENFYTTFVATPEPARFSIAMAEILEDKPDFDLANVRTLAISAANPDEDIQLYIDDIRLSIGR